MSTPARPPAPAGTPSGGAPRRGFRLHWGWVIFFVVLLGINYWLGSRATSPASRVRIPYSPFFLDEVNKGDVVSITSKGTAIQGTFKKPTSYAGSKASSQFSTEIPAFADTKSLSQLLESKKVVVNAKPLTGSVAWWENILVSFGPTLLFIGLLVLLMRRATSSAGGVLGTFGRARARRYAPEGGKVTFADVAGIDEAKQELSEVVDFLRHPERYSKLGARIPHGVLLSGPPGTGKTLLARAVAGEADVPFFALTGSSFVELFVGVGASRVRDLFAAARKAAPAIIFIDEVDAIGQRRGGALVSNDEREQTLNQLLAEMDGFDPASGVVVLAATNRPETLDPALLRPGRFDRQVEIPLPNLRERAAILAVHTRGKHLGPDVDLDVVARATPGFSGADLANLVNEAAIVAVRANRDVLSGEDFSEARDRMLLGRREATNALTADEKYSVAVHESGHALVAELAPHADPVAKVTILPAGQALGVTEQLPVDERHLYAESYLKDSLAVRLGGRAAELLVLGEASSGAASDLAGATDLATRMVREFGMSSRLGPVGFASGSPMYLGSEQVSSRSYAEETQRVIDEEVSDLLREAERRATALLTEHRDAIDRLVENLVAHETVDGDAVRAALAGSELPRAPAESGGPLREPVYRSSSR